MAILILPARGQIDTNSNGMSDVWERLFNNGELFDPQNPDHAPGADPDGDGWSNLKESIAGTDPFYGNPPEGMVATQITYLKDQEEAPTPEFPEGRIIDLTVISWETLPGKQYTLLFSPDLTASSWLAASAPIIGDGQPAAVSVTLTDAEGEEPDKLFWRVAIDDVDSDGDGLTDYEEFILGLNPYSAQTHPGISDFWIAENFPNSADTFDPGAVPHDNGLTNRAMHDLGIDPNQNVVLGPVNLGTQEEITDFPDLSFREENPADLYHQDSVEGWEAVIGEYIEVWDRDDGNPYMELQSHLGAHGVKQNFEMLPGSQVSFILRYKGRYEWYAPYDNAFTLDVEGAEQVTVNGSVVAPSGGVSSAIFMDDDDEDKYEEWHYASVIITADPDATTLVPITLSFTPANTDPVGGQEITRGGFVGLLPIEVVSRDKFLAGSFVIPNGWDSLEMEFIGPDGSLGKYGDLLGGGSTKIYDKVEDILADSDYADGSQSANQKVWFVRNSDDARKIDYYTCFDSVGEVQIKLYLNANPDAITEITHTLTTAEDFAEIIDYVNQWVEGTSFHFSGGVITPPLPMGAMQMNAEGEGGIHNLTRAALIPFFNVVNTVEGLGTIAFGLFDGIKAGLQDDWQLLVLIKDGVLGAGGWAIEAVEEELNKWKDDPLKRAAELKKAADRLCQEWVFKPMEQIQTDLSTWEGFKKRSWRAWNSVKDTVNKAWVLTKDSWDMIQSGLSDWVNDFADRMMEGAEKAHWSETVFSMDKIQGDINEYSRQASYTFGYTFGYLTEQVAVGILTGGTVKIGAVMAKGGAAFATQLAARRVLPVVGRLQFIKKWAASVAISIEMKMAVERGLIIAAETPLSLAVKDSVGEVIERGMARATFERSAFSTSKVLDEVVSAGNIKKLFLSPGREGQFWYKFAIFFEIMDVNATAAASQGWIKTYNRLLKFSDDIFEEDRAGDLLALYKAENSAAGREALRKSLDDFATNANPAALHPDLRFLDIESVASKGYRYVDSFSQLQSNGWKYSPHNGGGWYCSLDEITDSLTARSRLQLPIENSARYRVEFEILPIKDKVYVPYGRRDNADWLEPIARDYPDFGIGGGSQILVKDQEIIVKRVIDLDAVPPNNVIYEAP